MAPLSAAPGLSKSAAYGVAEPMLWQAASGMRLQTPAGYAWGRGSDGKPRAGPLRTRTQDLMTGIGRSGTYPTRAGLGRARGCARRGVRGVRAGVVGPLGRRAKMVEFVTALLGSPPDDVGGVSLWSSIPASPPMGAC